MDGLELASALRDLASPAVLVRAAREGRVVELACAMPTCLCPDGRSHFERRGITPKARWAPSADRHPLAGRAGGTYRSDNVRLAHAICNTAEGGRVAIDALRAWMRGPDWRAQVARNSDRLTRWAQTPEGREKRLAALRARGRDPDDIVRATARLAVWNATEEAHWWKARAGRVSTCKRWRVNRGRPCSCGQHDSAHGTT